MLSAARSSGRPSRLFLQRAGDELVELVADLVDRAEHDLAGGVGAVRGELERIEERVDQADLVQDRLAGRDR